MILQYEKEIIMCQSNDSYSNESHIYIYYANKDIHLIEKRENVMCFFMKSLLSFISFKHPITNSY